MSDLLERAAGQPAEQSTALVVIPAAELPTILAADDNDILGKLAKKVAAHKPDISTPKGRKEIASLAAEVASSKMDLIRLGKGLTEGWRKSTAAVNAECKLIEERMDALKASVRQPLTEFENREKARVAGHEAAIAEIISWQMVPADWTAEQIEARIIELSGHPHRDRDWQEFKERAQEAARASFNALKVAKMEATEREAAAAETARVAAEEAEQRRLAEERARREREIQIAAQAAREAREAAEREAQEKAAAEAAKVEAERQAAARRELEAKQAAERAERERAEAEERARQIEARRVARHKLAIAAIPEDPAWPQTESSAEIRLRLNHLNAIDVADFEEFANQAAAVIAAEIDRARAALAAAEQCEAQEAEAARIAREQEAARREEQARTEAAQAERQRQEREKAALAEAERKREANIAHARKIHREIMAGITTACEHDPVSESQMRLIISAIAKREIPHLSIQY